MSETPTKSLNCPACGAPITLRALGSSVMVVCAACRTEIDISKPEFRIIQQFNVAARAFDLALGARGRLRGGLFQIIGAMIRSNGGYSWTEYLLFNPTLGFRWLVEDEGHWSLGQTVKDVSELNSGLRGMRYQARDFRKFAAGAAIVDTVVGEFYWRVKAGSRAWTTDYVAPPLMLSEEKTETESIWTRLEYLDPHEVADAFKVPVREPTGIAPHQPSPAQQTLHVIKRYVWGSLALAVLLQVITVFMARNLVIPLGVYVPPADPAQEVVLTSLHLPARRSLNELTASAALDNGWVDVDYALVSKQTGESFELGTGFEFYSGADGDGAWSEGTRSSTVLVPSLPRGDYDLVIGTASGDSRGGRVDQPMQLSLVHDVTPWRNFWIVCAVIAMYPLVLVYRNLVFERERWSDSAFSPYTEHTSG